MMRRGLVVSPSGRLKHSWAMGDVEGTGLALEIPIEPGDLVVDTTHWPDVVWRRVQPALHRYLLADLDEWGGDRYRVPPDLVVPDADTVPMYHPAYRRVVGRPHPVKEQEDLEAWELAAARAARGAHPVPKRPRPGLEFRTDPDGIRRPVFQRHRTLLTFPGGDPTARIEGLPDGRRLPTP
jgi:hypothetical protein